jgi:hypothetical protein
MIEGWWVAFGFSGLPLAIGVLIYMLWRDKMRRKRREEEAMERFLREAGLKDRAPTSVRELERTYREKG